MRTRCVVSSFLSNLSWHDDNKIQMYQTAEEVWWGLIILFHDIAPSRLAVVLGWVVLSQPVGGSVRLGSSV